MEELITIQLRLHAKIQTINYGITNKNSPTHRIPKTINVSKLTEYKTKYVQHL